jgi:hypothetical protein
MRAAQFLAIIGRGSKGSNALENTEDRAGATSEQQDNVINTVNSLDPYGPSWQLVPGNVAAGTVYAQVPTSGTGDLTFTRASTATRTNSAGNIVDVASGVGRIHYRNADGSVSSTGRLLLEPQRTNLATFSEDFSNVAWAKNSVSISANTTTGPNGTLTADTLSADGTFNAHLLAQIGSATSGVTYTHSVYAKKGTNNFIQLAGTGGIYTAGNVFANFDLNNGVLGTVGAGSTATITNVGNGWYRCTMTATATASGTASILLLCLSSSATSARAEANSLTTNVFIWGAQLEAGANPSTYIPTTTAAVTRIADLANKSGISSLIGQTEGTIYTEVYIGQLQGSVARTFIDVGSIGNRIFLGFTTASSNTIRLQIDTALASSMVDFRAVVSSAGTIKVAAAYKNGDCALYVNGVAGTIISNGSISFTTLANLVLGQTISGTALLNDSIAQAALFPTRLTNAQLAAITTL